MKTVKIILALFLLMAVPAFAQEEPKSKDLDLNNIPKLNREVTMPKEKFLEQSKLIEETPFNDEYLAYRVRLGKNWTKLSSAATNNDAGLSKRILGSVVEYLGPATLDLRSVFRIRANDLPFDVTARDWFISYVFTNNYSLQGMDVSSDKTIQAQYVILEDGLQKVVRAVAQISGKRIILAEYLVPVEQWPQEKDMAKRCMSEFAMTKIDPAPVENMKVFPFVDIAQFSYPSSWALRAPPISSIERMSSSVTNFRGSSADDGENKARKKQKVAVVDGKIDVFIVTKGTSNGLADEVKLIKKEFEDSGLILGNLIEPIAITEHHPAIVFSKVEAYKINNKQNTLVNYEEWIGVFETPRRYYFVQMLTVGRQDNFIIWARNALAYRNVVKTLAPVEPK